MSGSDVTAAPGVFGTLGVADPANVPRARDNASAWTDSSGNFWLFGGYSNSAPGSMNDMWKYDPVNDLWTWIAGSDATINGIYGTLGVSDALNIPGSRLNTVGWFDASNTLWLFGGHGYGSSGSGGELNDLWKITP